MIRRPPRSPLFPSPTLFRSRPAPLLPLDVRAALLRVRPLDLLPVAGLGVDLGEQVFPPLGDRLVHVDVGRGADGDGHAGNQDRKSTRLNSSHLVISYAVFCL